MMGGYGFGAGMMLWSSLTTLLFLGGLGALAVWATARFTARQSAPEDPMTTLRRRLAAGEITQEQYERARKALQG